MAPPGAVDHPAEAGRTGAERRRDSSPRAGQGMQEAVGPLRLPGANRLREYKGEQAAPSGENIPFVGCSPVLFLRLYGPRFTPFLRSFRTPSTQLSAIPYFTQRSQGRASSQRLQAVAQFVHWMGSQHCRWIRTFAEGTVVGEDVWLPGRREELQVSRLHMPRQIQLQRVACSLGRSHYGSVSLSAQVTSEDSMTPLRLVVGALERHATCATDSTIYLVGLFDQTHFAKPERRPGENRGEYWRLSGGE